MMQPLKLLIIEDEAFCAGLFRTAFREHEVISASSGEEGINVYQEQKPDITFLDIGLPDLSGFEVLQKTQWHE